MSKLSKNSGNFLRLLVLYLCMLSTSIHAQNDQLKRITPEQAGFSSEKLAELTPYLEKEGSSSLILVSDGRVFFEWGDIYKKQLVHSIRKALLNSLYGIFTERGIIDTSATLKEIGIDDTEPKLTSLEKGAKVIDLLKSRSGIYHPAAAESEGMEASRPERGIHRPGEAFYYNNWDFNVLGAILKDKTGRNIYDLFAEEVAKPLGMIHYKGEYENIDASDADFEIPEADGFYQYEKNKSMFPAYHFRMSAYDLALYGILYANSGNWQGKQIVSKSWIEKSTKPYSIMDRNYGIAYGMLWNVNMNYASYQHTGMGVHMLRIYPDSKMVVVHRVDTENESEFTSDKLYPIFGIIFGARVPN
jgi:CubicO group peptidase (beta-lactamase class C family)